MVGDRVSGMSNRWKDLKCVVVVVVVVVRRRPSVPIEFPRKYISYIALVLFTVRTHDYEACGGLILFSSVARMERSPPFSMYIRYHKIEY